MTLSESSAKEGVVPHNLTLSRASQELIGPGMHQLEIRASRSTTASQISATVAVHLIEPVSGIQAAVASHTLQLGQDLEVNVSVSHGAPEELMFEVTGSNQSQWHKADGPRGEPRAYGVPVPGEGTATATPPVLPGHHSSHKHHQAQHAGLGDSNAQLNLSAFLTAQSLQSRMSSTVLCK